MSVAVLHGPAPLLPTAAAARTGLHWALWLFIGSMIVPAELAFEVGGLLISPQRLVLLAVTVGVFRWYLRTRDLRPADWCVIVGGLWAVAACFVNLDFIPAVERGGSYALETIVAFMLPVAFVRSIRQVRMLIRCFAGVVGILAALAMIEAAVGTHFIANTSAALMGKAQPFTADTRLGLLRARVSFSHQILFGVFCASLFALMWFEAPTVRQRVLRTGACTLGVFASLSSAAILLLVMQVSLIGLERISRITRHRSFLIAALCGGGLLAIEFAVQGGLTGFITRYLSLNPSTAYYRQLIWIHVTDDIIANPFFGTGGAWTRPAWMVSSVDHVYFAKSLRYGLPPMLLTVAAAVLIAARLLRRKPAVQPGVFLSMRTGWMMCVIGIAIAGLTVDYFGRALPFVMFIIGLGAALDRIWREEKRTSRA
ncbi:MAG: hypothetical protein AAF408_01975 [Pseudomonadota bacterium]